MNILATPENSRVKGQRLSPNSVLEKPAPRLRISVDVSTPSSLPVAARKDRRKLKAFNFQGITIPYGEYRSGRVNYWMLFYYQAGKRVRESRVSFAELKTRAEEVAVNIANGQTAMNGFGQDDRATFLRCRELAAQLNVPLEILVAEAVEARKKILTTNFKPRTGPEVVAALLDVKRREKKVGKKWLRFLERMLDTIAEFWPQPLHLIRAHDLNTWLRDLPGGLVYRRHHRGAAQELMNFAKAGNFIPREWDEFKHVENPEPANVIIKVWTPAEMVKLLAHTSPNMIPFTACQAFAGIRHEELRPEEDDKVPLDWRDFDWEQGHININEGTGKTGARLVPMSDNLVAWLKPYAKESGPVCEILSPSNALTRAKIRAGLASGKNETRNILRKSFGSYRLAVVKHIGQVADEMGNSPAKIKSNYRKPRPEREGKRWFDISPTTSEILQLNFANV